MGTMGQLASSYDVVVAPPRGKCGRLCRVRSVAGFIITLRKSEDFSQSILVTAVCLSVCLSVFLSLNDVQATILMQSS